MEILKNFGFDPVMLVAQIVNFLIIFYLLKRFLYKPVLEMLKKREDTIAKGLEQAEQSRVTLEKTLEQEKKIFAKATDEGKKIMEDAKLQAIEISKKIEEDTKKLTARILLEARLQIQQDAKETEKKLSEKVSILAASMLTKSLEGMFGQKEQKQIVGRALKGLTKVN